MDGSWIRKPKEGAASTAAVFVHGILSDGESCWRHDNGAYWPGLLKEHQDLEALGIYVFTYETGFFSGSYCLSDVVDALKEHSRLDGLLDCERIIFICHSMGGLVVRKFLVERAADLIDSNVEIGLFLVASPSLGSEYANWLSPLARFFGHAQAEALRFSESNAWLADLDKEFKNLKEEKRLKISGKELVEDKFVILPGLLRKQIVRPIAGAKYFADPFKVPISDHFSIAKPQGPNAIQHRLLCKFIMDLLDEATPRQKRSAAERIAAGLELDRRSPKEASSAITRRVKFVNPSPARPPRYFEDRHFETQLIADFLRDPASCILTVHGRGGVGKTALVCRFLQELERGSLPDDGGPFDIAGLVYLKATRTSESLFGQLVTGLLLTLNAQAQSELRDIIENPDATATVRLKAISSHLQGSPTVVLLDNFEAALSTEADTIVDSELADAIHCLVQTPHSLKVIITTRVVPRDIQDIPPALQMRIALSDGLSSPYAERVLRKLDADGHAGLKNAPESTLAEVAKETRGYPRALEAFYSILAADPSISVDDLVADLRKKSHSIETISHTLVGNAFQHLPSSQRKVMAALAIYGKPVSITAIEYLLEKWDPEIEAANVLKRLVAMHFVRREGKGYYVHPIDSEYCLSILPAPERISLTHWAADYYGEIAVPRAAWVTLDDVGSYIEQFRLRLESNDVDTAAAILEDLVSFLDRHGGFEALYSMGTALRAAAKDRRTSRQATGYVAMAQWRTGRISDGIATQEMLVAQFREDEAQPNIFSEHDDVFRAEGNLLIYRLELGATETLLEQLRAYVGTFETLRPWDTDGISIGEHHLAEALTKLGYLDDALTHQQRATALARNSFDANRTEAEIHNLGVIYQARGNIPRARALYMEALNFAKETNNALWTASHFSDLGICCEAEGRLSEALDYFAQSMEIRSKIGNLSGIVEQIESFARIKLAGDELSSAWKYAREALDKAADLRRPLHGIHFLCSEIRLGQNNIAEAETHAKLALDNSLGARWNSENSLGTALLRRGCIEEAKVAFARAQTQAELWLSRSVTNPDAFAGKALALCGLGACGSAATLIAAEAAYSAAAALQDCEGTISVRRRRFERLAYGVRLAGYQNILEALLGSSNGKPKTAP